MNLRNWQGVGVEVVVGLGMAVLCCSGSSTAPDMKRPPRDPEYCHAACENLRKLKCPEAEDFYDGPTKHTCEMDCVAIQRDGHAMKARCMSEVKSCEEVSSKCGI